jgi:lysozyme
MLKAIIQFILSLLKGMKKPVPVVVPKATPVAIPVETKNATKLHNLDFIKKHEALRLQAYLPTKNDKWTIGWGHTKTAQKNMIITEARAEELLRSDLKWVEEGIRGTVKVPLNQNQYDALGSLIFNIGMGNFSRSTLLKKLNAGDYKGAADQFLVWNKQKNKTTGQMEVLKGLVTRRKQEREMFLK